MQQQHNDFYLNLRHKITDWLQSKQGKNSRWVEYVLYAPDLFHVLAKLSLDKNVPVQEKAKLAVCMTYFVFPLDLVPEFVLGPAGYVDDVALSAYVLHSLLNNIPKEVVMKHWAGPGSLMDLTQKILKVSNEMLGSGVWASIKGMGNASPKKDTPQAGSGSEKA